MSNGARHGALADRGNHVSRLQATFGGWALLVDVADDQFSSQAARGIGLQTIPCDVLLATLNRLAASDTPYVDRNGKSDA